MINHVIWLAETTHNFLKLQSELICHPKVKWRQFIQNQSTIFLLHILILTGGVLLDCDCDSDYALTYESYIYKFLALYFHLFIQFRLQQTSQANWAGSEINKDYGNMYAIKTKISCTYFN